MNIKTRKQSRSHTQKETTVTANEKNVYAEFRTSTRPVHYIVKIGHFVLIFKFSPANFIHYSTPKCSVQKLYHTWVDSCIAAYDVVNFYFKVVKTQL